MRFQAYQHTERLLDFEHTSQSKTSNISKIQHKIIPPVTQSRSNLIASANQQSIEHFLHGSAASMPGAFDPEDLLNLEAFLDPLSINKPTASELVPKKRLDSNLNLLNHPARSMLHFLKSYAFKMLAEFRHAVAGSKGLRLLHSLV